MRKFILNYDWNNYKKGHVFENTVSGSIKFNLNESVISWYKEEIDLLVLSGALTEVTCKCDKLKSGDIVMLDDKGKCPVCGRSEFGVFKEKIVDTLNQLIKYLKDQEK